MSLLPLMSMGSGGGTGGCNDGPSRGFAVSVRKGGVSGDPVGVATGAASVGTGAAAADEPVPSDAGDGLPSRSVVPFFFFFFEVFFFGFAWRGVGGVTSGGSRGGAAGVVAAGVAFRELRADGGGASFECVQPMCCVQ